MPDSFTHLHVHSEYSLLDGASRIDDLVATVAEMEMPACAITDHGNLFGAVDFFQAGRRHGVNPIIGIELYMAPGSRFDKGRRSEGHDPYDHLILLAEDDTGYGNLMKLSSRAYLEGYFYKPRADKELLEELSEGLICLSGCLGSEVNKRLTAGDPQGATAAAAWYRDVFGPERYFVELQDHDLPEQRANNPGLIALARDLGVGLVVTNDSHYTRAADYEAHDAYLCIGTQALVSETERFKFANDQFYVKPPEAMQGLFPDHPETWRNTLAIAERCRVEIDFATTHLPRFDCPDGLDEVSWLRRLVEDGARGRYGDPPPAEAKDRLDFELGVIERMGYSAYFLIVADLVGYARRNGIRVGPGRGSAVGCAVAYATGITDMDPLEHGLLFERFLNPERVSMPDIDIDFDERRRSEMIRYVRARYGDDRVAQIVTFSTIKSKQAIRDAARVLGHPFSLGDRLAKMMPPAVMGKERTLAQGRTESRELREAWEGDDADARQVLDTAASLEGLKRQHSIHAAGVVIGARPIQEHCPVLRVEADGEIVTQFDGSMVESIGLLKMDFLGLRNLTVITDALAHVKAATGEEIDVDRLPLDDAATYALLSEGDTDGVFQLDSAGMKALCRNLKPDRFDDVVALQALYRPGPMGAGVHSAYARRKHGREPVSYDHPDLEEILRPTYGLLIYQEQVQQIARTIAGFSLGEADMIRKAIGKKNRAALDAQKAKFVEGALAGGYGRLGTKLWDDIEGFADYAFNKSHSVGYGMVSYQTAWLKAHHPVEYMAALLTSVKNNKDRLPLYLATCRSMGITVLQPDVNESATDFVPVSGAEIRFGLSAVRNVGEQVVEAILAARGSRGKFASFADFARKVDQGVLNKRTVESLVKAGAYESLGHPRKGLLMAFEPIIDAAVSAKRAEAEGQFSLWGAVDEAGPEVEADAPIPDLEFERKEKLAAEREMLGLYVSDHPLLGLERVLAGAATAGIAELRERAGQQATAAGILTGVAKKFTRRGEPYVTGTLEDLQAGIEVIFFPSVSTAHADILVEDEVLVVTGRIDDRDPPQLICEAVARPDLSEVDSAPLVVTLASAQCTPEVVGRLRVLLAEHPGPVAVELAVRGGAQRPTRLALPAQVGVTRSAGLCAELKHLLGPDAA